MSKKLDPRVVRTRKAFEDALLSLMKENDYEKISVSQIAREAGMNRATFYLHYFDKEDLLENYLTRALDELQDSAKIPSTEFNYDYTLPHPMFIRMFEHIKNNYQFYKIMLTDEQNSQILYSVSSIIESIVRDSNTKMKRDGIDFIVPQGLSEAYITSAYLGTIIWWLNHEMPFSPKYMAQQLTIMSTIGPFKDNPFLTNDIQ